MGGALRKTMVYLGLAEEVVAVAPDTGRTRLASKFAEMIGGDLAVLQKDRPAHNVARVTNVIGDIEGKCAVMTDDMVDTAGTLCAGAQALKEAGAEQVFACATHALFSGPALERISGSVLRQRFQITPWPGTSYNAVNQVVQPHTYTQNSVDMQGGFGGTRFYVSGANLTEPGAIRFLQGFVRNSFRANVDQALGSQWNIALRTSYSRSTQDGLNQEGGGQAFFRLTRVPAIVNVLQRDTLGRLYIRPNLQGGGSQNENPLWSLENTKREDVTNRFIGGLSVQYAPVNWFNMEGSLGYDRRNIGFSQINDKGFRTTTSDPATNNGTIFRGSAGNEALGGSVNATLKHDFSSDLRTRLSLL